LLHRQIAKQTSPRSLRILIRSALHENRGSVFPSCYSNSDLASFRLCVLFRLNRAIEITLIFLQTCLRCSRFRSFTFSAFESPKCVKLRNVQFVDLHSCCDTNRQARRNILTKLRNAGWRTSPSGRPTATTWLRDSRHSHERALECVATYQWHSVLPALPKYVYVDTHPNSHPLCARKSSPRLETYRSEKRRN